MSRTLAVLGGRGASNGGRLRSTIYAILKYTTWRCCRFALRGGSVDLAMKMYILVKEDLPMGFALVAVAHASLAAYLKFQDRDEMKDWLSGPFKKVICKVNDVEFENAKSIADRVVITESALDNREVAIALCPREQWPKSVGYFQLYR